MPDLRHHLKAVRAEGSRELTKRYETLDWIEALRAQTLREIEYFKDREAAAEEELHRIHENSELLSDSAAVQVRRLP